MGSDDDLLEFEERPGVRLGLEHVERSAGHFPGLDCLRESSLIDEPSARRIDDANAVAHTRERICAEQTAREIVEWEMQRYDVGGGVDVVEGRRRLDSELAKSLYGDEGVKSDDPHPEAERSTSDLATDAPEPEHAEGLSGQLDAGETLPCPRARNERRLRLRHVSR